MSDAFAVTERELYALFQQHAAPAYVKRAGYTADLPDGTDNQFADADNRRFPMQDKSATWTSACIFFNKYAADGLNAGVIRERLLQQARLFGILADVAGLEKQAATTDPAALPDDLFGYVQGNERRLPLRNTQEVGAAITWLAKHASQMSLPVRQDIADRLLTRAADLQLILTAEAQDQLEKTAGHGTRNSHDLSQLLLSRADAAAERRQPALRDEFFKLAQAVQADPQLSRDNQFVQQVQAVVDRADQQLHITAHYGYGVLPPEDYLYGITKRALQQEQDQFVPLANGSVYHKTALAKVRLADIREQLGDEIAETLTNEGLFLDMTKLSYALPALSRTDADLFDRLVRQLGEAPAMKQAAAPESIGSQESLEKLGQYYLDNVLA